VSCRFAVPVHQSATWSRRSVGSAMNAHADSTDSTHRLQDAKERRSGIGSQSKPGPVRGFAVARISRIHNLSRIPRDTDKTNDPIGKSRLVDFTSTVCFVPDIHGNRCFCSWSRYDRLVISDHDRLVLRERVRPDKIFPTAHRSSAGSIRRRIKVTEELTASLHQAATARNVCSCESGSRHLPRHRGTDGP